MLRSLLFAILLAGGGAAGAPASFGTLSPVAKGQSYVTMQLGFPELAVGYGAGIADDADFGVRGDLYVALQSVPPHFDVIRPRDWGLGLGAHATFRQRLARFGSMEMTVHLDPGLKVSPGRSGPDIYTCKPDRCARPAASTVLAADIVTGIALQLVSTRFHVALAADLDFASWTFEKQVLEPLGGAVIEWLLSDGWFIGFDARAGYTFPRAGSYQAHDSTLTTPNELAIRALLSFGWRG